MDPYPPRPEYQILIFALIAIEIAAIAVGNDYLLFGVLAIIIIVSYLWYKDRKKHTLNAKYNPEHDQPKEDWRGKTDKDNNPL